MTKYKISIIHDGCGGKVTKENDGACGDPECCAESSDYYICENSATCGLSYESEYSMEFQ